MKINMTDYARVTCPKCDTPQTLTPENLSDDKSKVHCRQCHSHFQIKKHLNDHLSKEDDNSDNELIYDDMAVEDEDKVDNTDFIEFGEEWALDATINSTTKSNPTFFDAADADDMDVSAPVEDESWLESLLAEEDTEEERIEKLATFNTSSHIKAPDTASLKKKADDTGSTNLATNSQLSNNQILSSNSQPTFIHKNNIPISEAVNTHSSAIHSKKGFNKTRIISNLLWLLGSIILLLLLLAQYTVFNLNTLLKEPQQRAKLESFCEKMNCTLPSADISQIGITNQTYKASRAEAHSTDIIAAINNKSEKEQLFPNLNVKLYGKDKVIGEFVAQPVEYLSTPQKLLGGQQVTLFMLTVEIDPNLIDHVQITSFY